MLSKIDKVINRKLRRNQTPWEIKLWFRLRNRRFYNLKFKRQVSVGEYVFDFGCDEKRLLIELDGSQHMDPEIVKKDQIKQKYAESQKYTVLRFYNNDVDNNMDGVLETIRRSTSS